MDSIQPSPLLRSHSRWRTYHRVRGTFSQLSGPLLVRLSQQAIEIFTDKGRLFSDLLQSRKSSVGALTTRSRSRNGQGNQILHRGSHILIFSNQSISSVLPSSSKETNSSPTSEGVL